MMVPVHDQRSDPDTTPKNAFPRSLKHTPGTTWRIRLATSNIWRGTSSSVSGAHTYVLGQLSIDRVGGLAPGG